MKILRWSRRVIFILASAWAIWASLRILFVPLGLQEVITASADGAQTAERILNRLSWYESQGLWGVAVVITFAFVYVVNGLLSWWDYLPGLAIFSVLSAVLTLLAGLSIGGAYAPALLGVLLGWLFLGIEKALGKKSRNPG